MKILQTKGIQDYDFLYQNMTRVFNLVSLDLLKFDIVKPFIGLKIYLEVTDAKF